MMEQLKILRCVMSVFCCKNRVAGLTKVKWNPIICRIMREQLKAFYIDWFNNFLTMERFAEYYNLSVIQAKALVDFGREIYKEDHG